MRKQITAAILVCGLLLTGSSGCCAENMTETVEESEFCISGFSGVPWGASLEKAKSALIKVNMIQGTDFGIDAVGAGGWIALDVNGVPMGELETRASLLFYQDHLAYGEYYVPQPKEEHIEKLVEELISMYGEPCYYEDVNDSEYFDVYVWMDKDENAIVVCDGSEYFTTDEETIKMLKITGAYKTVNEKTTVDILDVIVKLKEAKS